MFLFYDTETTGPKPHEAKIVQIAASLCDAANREIMAIDAIVYRDEPIPTGASNIHGITTEISQNLGLNEGIVLSMFEEMLQVSTTTVGHNESYDHKVVTEAFRRLDNKPEADPFAGKRAICTMKLATPVCKIPSPRGGFKWPTLMEAHQSLFGEGFEGAHGAMADVQACRRIFFHLQELARAA